jgi:hypothetical protein
MRSGLMCCPNCMSMMSGQRSNTWWKFQWLTGNCALLINVWWCDIFWCSYDIVLKYSTCLQYCIYYINTWYAIATELTYASTQFCKQCNRLNSLGYLVELICYAIFPQKKELACYALRWAHN